tara:strand:+ start:128 stop:1003 length:876 start_codon:yes stop_codon:yes gene_type:complete
MTTFILLKGTAFRPFSLNISGQIWHAEQPVIVGVINTTPDSFYEGSRSTILNELISKVEKLVLDGADWLDIGGCSTRPGATLITSEDEWSRIEPLLRALIKLFPNIPISIDTFRSRVAQKAIDVGASIINDVSGGSLDSDMWNTIAQNKVPYVLTHYPNEATPQNMRLSPLAPEDVFLNVFKDLSVSIEKLNNLGIHDILIDPGFGFGKAIESNYKLMSDLNGLQELDRPIYVGVSRKSMLWRILDSNPNDVLSATSALHLYALEKGAQILRVHDPLEANQVRKIWKNLYQ